MTGVDIPRRWIRFRWAAERDARYVQNVDLTSSTRRTTFP
nr:MAG TPA: hypothetical protein [Caudoviricetes sp.]